MRKAPLLAFSTAGAILLCGCLVLANILSHRFYLRFDLTEGGLYSLSPGSRRILGELDAVVEIRAFFSKNLPPEYAARRSYVRDLLEEYRQASRGRVRTRFVGVETDEQKREAMTQGIAPIEFNVISKEKFEIRQGFMGLVIRHADKKEVLPVLVESAGLEYDLTSRILQLTGKEKKVVGVLSSHGAIAPEALHRRVRERLERRYEIRPIDLRGLTPGAALSADLSALLVLGPTESLPDYHLYTLDQYLMSGRPAVFAVDTRRADLRQFMASSLKTRLPAWLKSHGVGLAQDFVLDAQNQKVRISQSRGFFRFTNIIDYPLFVVSTDLNKDHAVTRHLDALTFPLTSPLRVSTAALGGRLTVLARSSRYSWMSKAWERGRFHSISPLQEVAPKDGDERGPFVLAAAVDGPFESAFGLDEEAERQLPTEADRAAFLKKSRDGARLLVVGTSRFARSDMPGGEAGAVFLLNLVDWMALDSDLISIRSKGLALRPLKEIPPGAKTAVRWINILGPVLLVSMFGLVRLRFRRRRIRRSSARYASPDA